MGAHRRTLGIELGCDVDAMGQGGARRVRGADGADSNLRWQSRYYPQHARHAKQAITVDRRLHNPPRARQLRRCQSDVMDLDVIRMAIAALLVIDREYVGALLLEERCEARCHLRDRGSTERTGRG